MWRNIRTLIRVGPRRWLAVFGVTASVLGLTTSFAFFFAWIIPLAPKQNLEKFYGFSVLALCLAFIGFMLVYYTFLSYQELGEATRSNDVEFVTFDRPDNIFPITSIANTVFDAPLRSSERENVDNSKSRVKHVNIMIDNKRYSIVEDEGQFSAIIFQPPIKRDSTKKKTETRTPDKRPVQISQNFMDELREGGYFLDRNSRPHGKAVRTNSQK